MQRVARWLRGVGAAREPSTSKRNRDALSGLAEKRLADDMTDAYVDWREERAAVWLAYDGWTSAPTADAAVAFAVYRAALDREERAAEVYGRLVMQLAAGTSLTFNS
jgi:anti-sigma-K factor RskA